jgi:CubicO group peptidase (beta-lactamase class C family)
MKTIILSIICTLNVFSTTIVNAQTDAALETIFNDEGLMGMSVIGIRGDSIGYEGYYGKRDFARSLKVDQNTLYRFASVSKSVTGCAIMKLYEQGLCKLDRDINFYLGYSVRNPNFPTDSITIAMLLSHTSSLQDGTGYDGFLSATYSGTPPPPISNLLVPGGPNYTANMYRTEKPGTYFNYSNVEYGLLGTLIEKISNVRFDIFVKNNILAPIGITGSFNVSDLTNINDLAALYRKPAGVWTAQYDNYMGVAPAPANLTGYTIGNNGLFFAPQGGLRITAKDMAKFLVMIMKNGIYGNTRILNDTTVVKMRSALWTYSNAASGNNFYGLFRKWGHGLQQTTNAAGGDIVFNTGRPMWGHPGEAYGLVSDMYGDTLANTGVIFVTNGKGSAYTNCTNAFYCVEEKVFNAINTWTTTVPTAIENIDNRKAAFQVYPNPGKNIKYIKTDYLGLKKLIIYNAQGQIVAQQNFTNTIFDASAIKLPAGIYVGKLLSNTNKIAISKIIIQ